MLSTPGDSPSFSVRTAFSTSSLSMDESPASLSSLFKILASAFRRAFRAIGIGHLMFVRSFVSSFVRHEISSLNISKTV